jgi:hypothetical protein
MGSYEPGEWLERVGWSGAWVVSVVDLMREKGSIAAVEKFKSLGSDSALGPIGNRKRHPGRRGNEHMYGDPPAPAGRSPGGK